MLSNWCWRKLLRVPWTARKLIQSILKGINPEYLLGVLIAPTGSAEAELHTLAIWCKEPTHWKRLWCWERLNTGGEGGDRGWDGWMASLTWWTWVWETWETVKNREAWCAAVHGVTKSQAWLSNWATTRKCLGCSNHTLIPAAFIFCFLLYLLSVFADFNQQWWQLAWFQTCTNVMWKCGNVLSIKRGILIY